MTVGESEREVAVKRVAATSDSDDGPAPPPELRVDQELAAVSVCMVIGGETDSSEALGLEE